MNINRHNYEEYFLLYADNELSAGDRLQVENFADLHPDLKAELEMLLSTTQAPDEQVSFHDKESLYRTADTNSLVNITNYESWFVQYHDDELTNDEKAETEKFVYYHPELQAEFELMQQARMTTDNSIGFPDKKRLYKSTEERRKPVLISIRIRYAAAAALILLASITWFRQNNAGEVSSPSVAAVEPSRQQNTAEPVGDAATTTGNQQSLAENKPAPAAPEKENSLAGQPTISGQPSETPVILAQNNTERKDVNRPIGSETTASLPQVKIASSIGNPDISPADISITDISPKPNLVVNRPTVIETDITPNVVYVNNAADEDYVYVPGKNIVRKTPLKGILRKAGRFIEKNNPLSGDREKGGVFTASNDQQ